MSLEPQTYWSAVRHANHYTKWTGCEWETWKHFHYATAMIDWFQLNSANSSNQMNLIQNRKKKREWFGFEMAFLVQLDSNYSSLYCIINLIGFQLTTSQF